MKKWLVFIVTALVLNTVTAQQENPPYKQNRNIPAFTVQTVSNGKFSSQKLKKNTPLIVMFFSPGCDHCIDQFEDMTKRMNQLKSYQILMVTIQPLEELAAFNKKYQISKYPNVITGVDTDYFFPPFYQIANFPHFAFYDKAGKLIGTFEGNISVDNILKKYK